MEGDAAMTEPAAPAATATTAGGRIVDAVYDLVSRRGIRVDARRIGELLLDHHAR